MTKPSASLDESLFDRLVQSRIRDLGALARRLLDLPASDPDAYDAGRLKDVDVPRLHAIAAAVRGQTYRPAIFVHGVMPRSGTNYIADLIQLHGSIAPYPHRLWEFPLLYNVEAISAVETDFLRTYKPNAEVVAPLELLACLASGFLCYLQHLAGPKKTILLKVPHAEYLYLFHAVFPRDHCILVMRDGRDAVASHLNTFGPWPLKPGISELAAKWARSVRAVMAYSDCRADAPGNALVIRYEDANSDPERAVREMLRVADLSEDQYDFQRIGDLPVRGSSTMPNPDGVSWDPKKKPKDFQPLGRWRNWSPGKKRRFKRVAGKALVAAGYATDDSW
jgi:protein-tyrosine sulfotransferase